MFAPIQAIFVGQVGGDLLEAGLASSVYALAAAVVVIIAGRWSDNQKYKQKIVATGYLLTGLGCLGYLFVDSVWMLFVVQAWIGMAQACMAPAFDALYADQIGSKRKQSSRWGLWEAENYLAIAAGGALGGIIAQFFSFKALFVAMAVLSFGSGLVLLAQPNRLFKR
jgi:MFS family permease